MQGTLLTSKLPNNIIFNVPAGGADAVRTYGKCTLHSLRLSVITNFSNPVSFKHFEKELLRKTYTYFSYCFTCSRLSRGRWTLWSRRNYSGKSHSTWTRVIQTGRALVTRKAVSNNREYHIELDWGLHQNGVNVLTSKSTPHDPFFVF